MRAISCLFALSASLTFAQEPTLVEAEEQRLLAATEALLPDLPVNIEEATQSLWRLCQVASQTKNSKVHWRAREIADVISANDPLNPRARFVYGYFRAREAIETFEPITHKRRMAEGQKIVQDALMMGARDPHFLHDAGLLVMSLSPKLNLIQRGLDALVLAKRSMGTDFDEMPAERRADWYAGMGKGFDRLDLVELARNHFTAALELAPDTPSGQMARDWLKARSGQNE